MVYGGIYNRGAKRTLLHPGLKSKETKAHITPTPFTHIPHSQHRLSNITSVPPPSPTHPLTPPTPFQKKKSLSRESNSRPAAYDPSALTIELSTVAVATVQRRHYKATRLEQGNESVWSVVSVSFSVSTLIRKGSMRKLSQCQNEVVY